jgi:hypothetical protein
LTEPAARRRRVPTWAWGAAGLVVAAVYAAAFEKMRFGPPLVMLALGGMTLAFTAAALWRVIDPLSRAAAGSGPAVADGGARWTRELEREKQLVLKAIKEIEFDFQMRKIAESEYREMVERYRSRAMRLISELDAGSDYRALIERELKMRLELPPPAADAAAPPAATARTTCPSCRAPNDDDAQFCKKCGAKLG